MKSELARAADSTTMLDGLVDDLQRLRNAVGDVSYAEIAARIARRREVQGMSPAAARVARSSVFDAFGTGRRRINAELVAEIVRALGADDAMAEVWRRRCLEARLAARRSSGSRAHDEPDVSVAPPLPVLPVSPRTFDRRALTTALVVALLIGCVGVNLFGDGVVDKFQLPIWLDMIGTAIAAIVLGSLHAVLVGVLTNLLGAFQGNPETLLFLPVNVIGALVWGYGYRRFGGNRGPIRFLLLNVAVAISCSLVAVPINVLVFGGAAGHASDSVVSMLVSTGEGLWAAVFSANLMLSLVDKIIAGCIALVFARLLLPLGLDPDSRGTARLDDHGRK